MCQSEPEKAWLCPTTHWSQIFLAGQADQTAGARATEELLRLYYPPLLFHLQHQFRIPEDDARDWLQSFIEKKVLTEGLLQWADASKGKFRSFLLKTLDNFVLDELRRRKSPTRHPKGGTISIEELTEPHAAWASGPAVSAFDLEWARTVLAEAERRTQAFYENKQTNGTWAAFKEGFLLPRQTGEKRPSDGELAKRHGFASARQASNAIITAKRAFAYQLRQVVAQYVANPNEVDGEIRELIAILAGAD